MGSGDRQYALKAEARDARGAHARVKAAKAGRDEGFWIPWLDTVQQSPGWRRASHTARSLLMDIVHSGPNGKLSASMRYLEPLGWTSAGTVSKAVAELIECGLLVETRKGARPNRAAWYAITWMKLKHTQGLDIDPRLFATGGYKEPMKPAGPGQAARTRAATLARRQAAAARAAGYTLAPSDGAVADVIAPSDGRLTGAPTPSDGAMQPTSGVAIAPSDGAYLETASSLRSSAANTTMGRMLRKRVQMGAQPGYAQIRKQFPVPRARRRASV